MLHWSYNKSSLINDFYSVGVLLYHTARRFVYEENASARFVRCCCCLFVELVSVRLGFGHIYLVCICTLLSSHWVICWFFCFIQAFVWNSFSYAFISSLPVLFNVHWNPIMSMYLVTNKQPKKKKKRKKNIHKNWRREIIIRSGVIIVSICVHNHSNTMMKNYSTRY